jgi:hypothetical protein
MLRRGDPCLQAGGGRATAPFCWLAHLHATLSPVTRRQQRADRARCYPTPAQVSVLARTFGSARCGYTWVQVGTRGYNGARRLRTDASSQRQERRSSAALTDHNRAPETAGDRRDRRDRLAD